MNLAPYGGVMKNRYIKLIFGTYICLAASTADALTANFDTLPVGSYGSTVSDGGITFSNFDNFSFLIPTFYIEDETTSLTGSSFSPSNALSFASGSSAYGSFGSMTISFDGTANAASLDIFKTIMSQSRKLTLSAYYQGSLAGSSEVWLTSFDAYTKLDGSTGYQYTLSIDGVQFDELRLVSSDGSNASPSFILLDNVVIATPIPPAGILLASGLMLLGAQRRKKTAALTA